MSYTHIFPLLGHDLKRTTNGGCIIYSLADGIYPEGVEAVRSKVIYSVGCIGAHNCHAIHVNSRVEIPATVLDAVQWIYRSRKAEETNVYGGRAYAEKLDAVG